MNPKHNSQHRKPKLLRVMDTLRICAQVPVGDDCPRECPFFIECSLGNTAFLRETTEMIEALLEQRTAAQTELQEVKHWENRLYASYSQVSKALCDKEFADLSEVLSAIDQVKISQKELGEKCHQLLTKCERLERERDAAVRDCGCFPCQTCEERDNGDLCTMCEIQGGYRKFHQWRGVKEE